MFDVDQIGVKKSKPAKETQQYIFDDVEADDMSIQFGIDYGDKLMGKAPGPVGVIEVYAHPNGKLQLVHYAKTSVDQWRQIAETIKAQFNASPKEALFDTTENYDITGNGNQVFRYLKTLNL